MLVVLVVLLLLGGLGTTLVILAIRLRPDGEPGLYPQGHFLGMGISVGVLVGCPLGLVLGLVLQRMPLGFALGPAIGIALGSALGTAWERRNKDKIKLLTADEQRARRIATSLGAISLALTVGVLIYVTLSP